MFIQWLSQVTNKTVNEKWLQVGLTMEVSELGPEILKETCVVL